MSEAIWVELLQALADLEQLLNDADAIYEDAGGFSLAGASTTAALTRVAKVTGVCQQQNLASLRAVLGPARAKVLAAAFAAEGGHIGARALLERAKGEALPAIEGLVQRLHVGTLTGAELEAYQAQLAEKTRGSHTSSTARLEPVAEDTGKDDAGEEVPPVVCVIEDLQVLEPDETWEVEGIAPSSIKAEMPTVAEISAARPRHAALQLCLGWDWRAPAACAQRYRHLYPQDIALGAATASGAASLRGASEGAFGALEQALVALEAQGDAPELASAQAMEGIVGTAAKTPVKTVLVFKDTLAETRQAAAAPNASPWAHYRLAIVLEGLGLWGSACEAYSTARRGLGGEGAAALGEWRCRQECAAAMQSLRVGSAAHGSAQNYASVTDDELQQERHLQAEYGCEETPLKLLLHCTAAGDCDGDSCRGLHVALAEAHLQRGDGEAALSACEHVLRRHSSGDAEALALSGQALAALGRLVEAAAVLRTLQRSAVVQ